LLNLIKEYEKYERMDEVLRDVFGTFRHLAVDMRNHFEKEEYMAFPMMLDESVNKNELTLIIAELENEHGKTEEYISSIEKSSGYYSYRYEDTYLKLIFDKMRELFTDISEHEGKENGILFPKFM
nr:hemerythrin domain-containing protein [Lachnospiraceae bacterium]